MCVCMCVYPYFRFQMKHLNGFHRTLICSTLAFQLSKRNHPAIVLHIISASGRKREKGRKPERPAEECSSFFGSAHTTGPVSNSDSLNQHNLIQNRTGEQNRRTARGGPCGRASCCRFMDRKLCSATALCDRAHAV